MKESNRTQLITDTNPMGTDGFEFVEFASANPQDLHQLFRSFGFVPVRKHKSKDVTLYQQGDIRFLVNGDPELFGRAFFERHGPCACSFGIRVADADYAFERAISLGAESGESEFSVQGRSVPCIKGIGDSHLYLVDRYGDDGSIFDDEFELLGSAENVDAGVGLDILDHLTHNVAKGDMDKWAGFYERLFNFREIRFFDIEGKLTGLKSRALTSPCGKVKIPINESSDDKSQIAEFIEQYNGEGIQHIALTSRNIFDTVDRMRELGTGFMPSPPDTYYEMLSERLPWHDEDESALHRRGILLDGGQTNASGDGLLLQIFTNTVIGPIFFEIIQRKGDEGFGEGNFKALFESIERDQIRRGVLRDEP
ncbi:4-hydroxyphenylpyruvate dioxygenase [Endozoicomonas montiporae]|uniref:4-hydroxyphenylpyruvate dioxygenase n=2 Tax=Endozoicomonas montiporae TaxID=1027273 RepID=A0A081NC04_9GAMM|nr:4-hydroxyphenylpyruvate dioxygenase [Endozoicomonas montiporae]AMO56298.1 4-hydroxyphenylpyruvate dioxygenase [Endozoicomonas montiporae CL-33]KEQ15977.1 4-hydroxyphenylpyruvate dioxygenase [Endozoicomonas montiporae]